MAYGYCDRCRQFFGDDALTDYEPTQGRYCEPCHALQRQPGRYRSITELTRAVTESGSHFFETDTMRFFNSRVYPEVYAGRIFITSEKQPNTWDRNAGRVYTYPRRYTLREIQDEAPVSIREIGEFQQYRTLDSARRAARRIAHAIEADAS